MSWVLITPHEGLSDMKPSTTGHRKLSLRVSGFCLLQLKLTPEYLELMKYQAIAANSKLYFGDRIPGMFLDSCAFQQASLRTAQQTSLPAQESPEKSPGESPLRGEESSG